MGAEMKVDILHSLHFQCGSGLITHTHTHTHSSVSGSGNKSKDNSWIKHEVEKSVRANTNTHSSGYQRADMVYNLVYKSTQSFKSTKICAHPIYTCVHVCSWWWLFLHDWVYPYVRALCRGPSSMSSSQRPHQWAGGGCKRTPLKRQTEA